MAASEIKSVALIEYDNNDDVMLTWSYPGVTPELQDLLVARAEMDEETNVPFSFGKYKGDWHYILTVDVEPDADVLTDVQSVSLCVLANAFNPEKYYALLKILSAEYLSNGEAVYIMQNMLKCITKGSCGPKDNKWEFSKFVNKHSYLANCSIKKIIKKFGLHSILLWAATILRKRVAVLGSDWESVFVITRALPQFVWHRQNWDILWPQVQMTPEQIEDLQSGGCYCAGFIDSGIRSREDLYDILVDVSAKSITVAEDSASDFAMDGVHREFAEALVAKAEDPDSTDEDIIKMIVSKNKEFIKGLMKLKGDDDALTMEKLNAKGGKFSKNLKRFFLSMAMAEEL
mmetsp:Transcript_9791/g.14322  ORF Transcript_9791/g.14322 Transcript_9791/m.14322 type:complete len:345 (-) Transcript_9791:102-1136(-)|eukprot:CAMPEP_0195521688 /NCGR_PEP_ID=MMETSP0794_2-20130614/19173_1 /TAXON_ID=515487 /ORGANISM="Stephanopyxis turris, Strain CCMP 815" /LENGTH=344 /DNA_ID=CAMNT_0040651297 /DNA_START=73 /DNA_END=1107 /DNA_ORIENTATION=-